MSDGATIAGVSVATIALIISIFCLIWILGHIGVEKKWKYNDSYNSSGIFNGGEYY